MSVAPHLYNNKQQLYNNSLQCYGEPEPHDTGTVLAVGSLFKNKPFIATLADHLLVPSRTWILVVSTKWRLLYSVNSNISLDRNRRNVESNTFYLETWLENSILTRVFGASVYIPFNFPTLLCVSGWGIIILCLLCKLCKPLNVKVLVEFTLNHFM